MTPQMLRAQGLAILEECKADFTPIMRLVGSEHMLDSFVAGMMNDPLLQSMNVTRWCKYAQRRGTDKHIEDAGIACLSAMYFKACEMREKRNKAKNTPCTQDNSDE